MVKLVLFLVALLGMVLIDPATLLNSRNVFYDLKYDGFSWHNLCRAVKKHMIL